MLNQELVDTWLGYGCAKKGELEVAGGFIFGTVKGVQVPLYGTNAHSGARFSLMPLYSNKVWLEGKSYKLPISPQLRKTVQTHCLFRAGTNWNKNSNQTLMEYYAQQWMRGYWCLLAELDDTGINLRVPNPCYAGNYNWGHKPKLTLPPVSQKWQVADIVAEMKYNGPYKENFHCPDVEWPFQITPLGVGAGKNWATLPHILYHFKMYQSNQLAGAKTECNKHYSNLKFVGV